jgi:predicted AAA+ superfamily ATPase
MWAWWVVSSAAATQFLGVSTSLAKTARQVFALMSHEAETNPLSALLKDPINTAARLMCMPEAVNGVLCDPITRELCQKIQGVSFRNLGPRNLKGRDQPMTVYRWNDSAQGEGQIGKLSTGWNNRPTVDVANLVGYDQQKKQIKTVVAQFASDNLGKTVVIEGEHSCGS